MRPLVVADAGAFYQLNADPEVMRYVPDEPFKNEAEAKDFLRLYPTTQPAEFGRMAVIRQADRAWLGWCGLKYHPLQNEVDLGFRFYQRYWGRGYATEAGLRSIQYGFEDLGVNEIMAHVADENIASQKVLEKCGLRHTGRFQEVSWAGKYYSITKPIL